MKDQVFKREGVVVTDVDLVVPHVLHVTHDVGIGVCAIDVTEDPLPEDAALEAISSSTIRLMRSESVI